MKRALLVAVTIGIVFGYVGLFSRPAAGIENYATSGIAEITVDYCYDTVSSNYPVPALGRVACNGANPATLATSTTYTSWTVINQPIGNRLTSTVTTFTPSDVGEWSSAPVPCTPDGTTHRCAAGEVTGDFLGRVDAFCDGQLDELSVQGGVAGPGLFWPDPLLWEPADFRRIAAVGALGGAGPLASSDPDSYIHDVVPFPTTWDFRSSDLTTLNAIYVVMTGPIFFIQGGWKLNNVAYTSTYAGQAGLVASATLFGDSPDNPPNDDVILCQSSPQDSVTSTDFMITPGVNTIIPRWTILESKKDLGSSAISRILDWQCDRIGAGLPDADGDCDPDSTDWNDSDKDTDDDLVPDGIELAYGSIPTQPDTDNDGADDYTEIFQFTNPQSPDSDSDFQLDKQDTTPTNGANVPSGNNLSVSALNPERGYDAADMTDDNCPNRSNASQLNTDALWQYHGMGGNVDPDTTGSLLGQNSSTGDRTNPNEDQQGDACDLDDDNDALPDVMEPLLRIRDWSGPTDLGVQCTPEPTCSSFGDVADTTVCVGATLYPLGPNVKMPIRTMSPVLGDVDYDLVLDGRECQFRSRPDASCRTSAVDAGDIAHPGSACTTPPEALNCSTGTIAPAVSGCAQPAGNATTPGGGDEAASSGDGLYLPGTAVSHVATETFYRTRRIWIGPSTVVDDIDGDFQPGELDLDSDRDTAGTAGTFTGIRDGWEVRYYNTAPSALDSDGDGCWDGDEITDINGDGSQNPADAGLRAQAAGGYDSSPANGRMDTDVANFQGVSRYHLAANRDLNKDGLGNPADAGILAAAIAAPGGCSPYNETGIIPSKATKNLP